MTPPQPVKNPNPPRGCPLLPALTQGLADTGRARAESAPPTSPNLLTEKQKASEKHVSSSSCTGVWLGSWPGAPFLCEEDEQQPAPHFPASILGQNKQCVTFRDTSGALHHLPWSGEVLEGKGLSGGPGETWEIWAVLLATVTPVV